MSKGKRLRGIRRKIVGGLILFAVTVATVVCFVSGDYIESKIIDKYEYAGTAVTSHIASEIDGDRVLPYLQTHRPDYYYNKVLDELNMVDEIYNSLYLYIAIPDEDNVLYIWSNGFSGEDTIGYTTAYAEGGKEWMEAQMAGDNSEPLCFVEDPEFGSIATAATPIYNSKGEAVALVLADFSLDEIRTAILSSNLTIAITLFAILAIFTVIYYWFIQKNIVDPVMLLTNSVKDITDNLNNDEYTYNLDIHTKDEIEELSIAFSTMNTELRDYIKENTKITTERERVRSELDMASSIQASQLPTVFPAFPERKDFDIYASMTPAKEVGGDFYDFFLVDEDHIALVIADVSGKGIPAALFMMISKLLIQSRMMMGESPAEALSNTNAQLMQNNAAKQFVTVWLAIFDLKTGKGVVANAGHEHPAIKRADGQYELAVYKHSPPVATMKKMKFKEHEFELNPGDTLFVYTDGVAEANNADNDLFGTERMLEALNKDPDASAEDTLKNVMDGINDFVAGADQFDDITMMCFRYFGPQD